MSVCYLSYQQYVLVYILLLHRLVLGFTDAAAGTGTYVEWKVRLDTHRTRIEALTHETLDSIDMLKYSTAEDIPCEDSVEIDQGNGGMYECEILLRSESEGSDVNTWPRYRLKLSNLSTLEFTPIDYIKLPTISDKLSPCSSVYESSLGDNTLQIVTAQTTLHTSVTSESERMFLLAVLREAIRVSVVDTTDTLFARAILKVDEDEVYSVAVVDKESMGLGFKRAGEWMVVSKSKNSGVTVDSVLCAINSDNVLLRSYRDTKSQMRQTHPPLSLSFRCCLRKQDDLLLMSKTVDVPLKVVWEPRTFVLLCNSLAHYPLGTVDTEVLKNDVNSKHMDLVGAQLKLLDQPYLIAEDKCCFMLTSGLATITVQCSSYIQVRLLIRYTYISSLLIVIIIHIHMP